MLDHVAQHYAQSMLEVERWPWPLFCGRWADMVDKVRRETLRERRQQRRSAEKRNAAEAHAEARRALAEHGGGGGVW